MAPSTINVLLTTFPGLGLPSTLSLPMPSSVLISDLRTQLLDLLPQSQTRFIFTTTNNRELLPSSQKPLTSLLPNQHDTIVPIRLSLPVCGGKGGFGSQLRAAGGRMSSKRKRNQGEEFSSNRNLDGRRLRTVAEAKALAEYLALKPEMEKREKDARRKRWEQVVELAEKREAEIKNGSRGRIDGKWVEEKDEAGERTREAVLQAMKRGEYHDSLNPSIGGASERSSSSSSPGIENDESEMPDARQPYTSKKAPTQRSYFGFDDEDDISSDSDIEAENQVPAPVG
ncbi:MAG: hypothetical protein Q9220_005101 [cf. Caloplaca sp. 1 TL-2023]